ncbi:hypothetical protein LZ32DRAFT_82386 [Colletotrichum eremochloae]|nr:hypothetical protein LZ32DRAFT_82386 [Colletotrichum eremochloae]
MQKEIRDLLGRRITSTTTNSHIYKSIKKVVMQGEGNTNESSMWALAIQPVPQPPRPVALSIPAIPQPGNQQDVQSRMPTGDGNGMMPYIHPEVAFSDIDAYKVIMVRIKPIRPASHLRSLRGCLMMQPEIGATTSPALDWVQMMANLSRQGPLCPKP